MSESAGHVAFTASISATVTATASLSASAAASRLLNEMLEESAAHVAFTASMLDWPGPTISVPLLRANTLLNNTPIVRIDCPAFPGETLVQPIPRALYKVLVAEGAAGRPSYLIVTPPPLAASSSLSAGSHHNLLHLVGVLALVTAGDAVGSVVCIRTRQRVELTAAGWLIFDDPTKLEPPRFALKGSASFPAHVWRRASARGLAARVTRTVSYRAHLGLSLLQPHSAAVDDAVWWLARLAPLEALERRIVHNAPSVGIALLWMVQMLSYRQSLIKNDSASEQEGVVDIALHWMGRMLGSRQSLVNDSEQDSVVCKTCYRPPLEQGGVGEGPLALAYHPFASRGGTPLTSLFSNPYGHAFRLILVTANPHQQLPPTHAPVSEHTWFPGYAWTAIRCSHCHASGRHTQQVGWRFEWVGGDQIFGLPACFVGYIDEAVVVRWRRDAIN